MRNKKLLILLSLLVILTIAGFFRLWQLDSIPPGLYPDEAINGNEALDSLETGNFKVFYSENNGREGLFIWLIALSFSIFGPSIWALKIVPAIFGILTVLGIYLLTKKILPNTKYKLQATKIALLSSFFLAISFWHINFSRIGFRAILVPFALVFAFYFLFRGFRTTLLRPTGYGGRGKIYNFIISGIFFAFGFYTYISYRFVIFILATALLCWWFVYKKRNLQKKFLLFVTYCLTTTLIVALPIGIYFLTNPQDFFGRASGVSVFSQPNPIYEIGKSLIINLQMLNFYGDGNWRHNFAGSPMLLWPIGIFFLIGIILSIKKAVVSTKNKNYPLLTTHYILLGWFLFMLMPGILSFEGIPHALRVIGVIPVVYIFAALGGFWLFEKLKNFYKTRNQKIIFGVIIIILLFTVTYAQFDKYFYQWAKKPGVRGAFSENYVKIGNYLNSLPEDTQKYVIVNQSGVPVPFPDGIPMPAQTVIFIEKINLILRSQDYPPTTYLLPEDLNQIKMEKNLVIVPLQYDENLFVQLSIFFLDGEIKEEKGVWIYQINNKVYQINNKCGS